MEDTASDINTLVGKNYLHLLVVLLHIMEDTAPDNVRRLGSGPARPETPGPEDLVKTR